MSVEVGDLLPLCKIISVYPVFRNRNSAVIVTEVAVVVLNLRSGNRLVKEMKMRV